MKKHILLFAALLITVVCEAQINASFQNTDRVNFQNTNNVYSYTVRILKQGNAVEEFLVPAGSTVPFNYKFKRKGKVKRFSYTYTYDQKAKQYDQDRSLAKSNYYISLAQNIERECIASVREKRGWELVIEGVLLGDGRLLAALYRILSSGGMSKEELFTQIKSLAYEIENDRMSDRQHIWKLAVLRYFKEVYEATDDAFNKCPGLTAKKMSYLRQAQDYQEATATFEKKYETERFSSSEYNLWRSAQNRQLFVSGFTGFGVEIQSLANGATLQRTDESTEKVNTALSKSIKKSFEVKVNIPLSRQFNGIILRKPARLFLTGTIGQANYMFTPISGFLGIKSNAGNDAFTHLVGEKSSLGTSFNYGGLGFRYMFMPDNRMWLSWEVGGFMTNNITTLGTGSYVKIENNRIVASQEIPQSHDVTLFNNTGIASYLRIQYSVALFALANRSTYPNRKKVVLGISIGGNNYTNWNKNSPYQLTQVQQNKNTFLTTPLKIEGGISLSCGLYIYL